MNKVTGIVIAVIVIIAVYFFFFNKDTAIKVPLPLEGSNSIVVTSPIKDAQISSPLVIAGRARGTWFFEGSFPVFLVDADRNIIAEGHVTAQGEWMTQDFVKFVGSLQFNNYIKGQKGSLILKKDNPSGLPENDEAIRIPIMFK